MSPRGKVLKSVQFQNLIVKKHLLRGINVIENAKHALLKIAKEVADSFKKYLFNLDSRAFIQILLLNFHIFDLTTLFINIFQFTFLIFIFAVPFSLWHYVSSTNSLLHSLKIFRT